MIYHVITVVASMINILPNQTKISPIPEAMAKRNAFLMIKKKASLHE
jgi:hypothetical protein